MPEEAVADTAAENIKPQPNRGGRPRKPVQQSKSRIKRDPLAAVEVDAALDTAPERGASGRVEIPKPLHFRFGTDQPSPRRPEHFFQWWGSLTAAQKRLSLIYVYRNYPVIGIKVEDKKSPSGYRMSSQIDKRSGTDILTSLDDILHHYGSGNYTIRFNQAEPNKAVCLCVIQGLRDEQHPPVVDLNTLLIDDPSNKPYIEGLRLRGVRVPGVDPINEEDQMGAAAVSQLVGTVQDMVQKNSDLSVRVGQAQAAAASSREERKPSTDESIVSTALATGMKIISNASDTQSAMLKSAMDKVGELSKAATPAAAVAAPDPLAMLDKVGNLLRSMAPPTASTTQLDMLVAAALKRSDTLEDKLAVVQSQQLSFLQTLLTQQQQQQQQQAAKPVADTAVSRRAASDSNPTTPLEMLRDLIKLKDGLAGLTGDNPGASDSAPASRSNPNTPWWATLLQQMPSLLQTVATISSMVAVASYNSAIAKTGTGIPTPVSMPVINPPAEPESLEPDANGEIPLPPTDGSSSELPQPGDATVNAYHMFLRQLEKPLILALENNEPGDQFAEKLVGWQGQVAYDLLHGLGKDQLISILATYQPIWSVASAIPIKFSQFLDEFMSYGDNESVPDLPLAPPQRDQPHAVSPSVKVHNPRAKGSRNPNPANLATVPETQ